MILISGIQPFLTPKVFIFSKFHKAGLCYDLSQCFQKTKNGT